MAVNIHIAGIQMDSHLVWADRWKWSPIREQEYITVYGQVESVIDGMIRSYHGRPITLVTATSPDVGWQKIETMRQLKYISETVSGANSYFDFTYYGILEGKVKFVHVEGGAVQFEPVVNTAYSDSRWCTVQINLRFMAFYPFSQIPVAPL